jgi:chromosome partitioning protein
MPLSSSQKTRFPRRLYRISDLRSDFIDNEVAIDEGAQGDTPCRTIAMCNHKGGVGKTVTAINLSAGFAARGLQTLLIDLDPQGHSGLGLGLDTDGLEARESIVRLRPNLDILASNVDLALAERELARFKGRERRLKELVNGLKESYRYIVVDCPPSTGLLTANALVASQTVVVPVTPACLSIHDLSQIVDLIAVLTDTGFSEPTILILLTLFVLQKTFGGHPRKATSQNGDPKEHQIE